MRKHAEARTLSLLFADTHGFSKLSNYQIGQYVTEVLPIIAQVLDTYAKVAVNTWGDGLFAAFDTPSTAATCALELRDKFRDTHWETKGLPDELAVRIALHIGEVYIEADPVRKELALFGREVNRTARIEPIVAPTQIYATKPFMSLLGENVHFKFDPLGERDLAKSWGRQELFGLRRPHESSINALEPSPLSPVSPTANSVMTLANEALARHPDQIGGLLKFVDTQNFRSRVAWRNWYIKLKYDLSKLGEGVITENIEWEYNLFNHSGAPVTPETRRS
jgi:class 3 adenylate cyclase